MFFLELKFTMVVIIKEFVKNLSIFTIFHLETNLRMFR